MKCTATFTRKFVLPVLVFLFCLSVFFSSEVQTMPQRISGEDRYSTSVEISRSQWDSSSTVILARGDDFPDALTGTPLAYKKDAPILLTRPGEIPEVVKEEIKRLDPETVIILGEEMAVSLDVEYELRSMGVFVDRIGGMDRYETAVRIAERVGIEEQAILASGTSFPDALAVSTYAAPRGIPVLLSSSDELPEAIEITLSGVNNIIVVGGEAVISEEIVEQLSPGTTRIAGENRYETAASVVKELEVPTEEVFLATGLDFADALTGSALASKRNACLLLVNQEGIPEATRAVLEEKAVSNFYILGGTNAVSMEIAEEIESEYGDTIRLGWHFTYIDDDRYVQDPPSETGYNVYAPTAYVVEGEGANVSIDRDDHVMDRANESGYETWVTVQAFGKAKVEELFQNPQLQSELIEELLEKAREDNVDGINIDFENMGRDPAIRDGFTAFMEELYQETRRRNITLSVDVTRPGNTSWSACYDHGALAEASDYVVLMAYDEHWSGSPVAGPVASLSWVESSIEDVLDEGVPPEKLVLGVPFYSRTWETEQERIEVEEDSVLITAGAGVNVRPEPSTELTEYFTAPEGYTLPYLDTVQGQEINGNRDWYKVDLENQEEPGYVTAEYTEFLEKGEVWEVYEINDNWPVRLGRVREILENFDDEAQTSYYTTDDSVVEMHEVSITDDEGIKLVEYRLENEDDYTYKLWAEDYETLKQRRELKQEYNLAGIAAWSLDWQGQVDDAWLRMYQD